MNIIFVATYYINHIRHLNFPLTVELKVPQYVLSIYVKGNRSPLVQEDQKTGHFVTTTIILAVTINYFFLLLFQE